MVTGKKVHSKPHHSLSKGQDDLREEMKFARSVIELPVAPKIILTLYLLVYLTLGINTELKQIELFPIPEHLLQDQIYYNRGAKRGTRAWRSLRKSNRRNRLLISSASTPDR